MAIERLAFALILWTVVVSYLGLRARYARRNLLLVAAGFGAFLVALALHDQQLASGASLAGAFIALAALSGGLTVRGVDDERRRKADAPHR